MKSIRNQFRMSTICVLGLLIGSLFSCTKKSNSESQAASEVKGKVLVEFKTTKGDMVIELDADKAPITVKNFLDYVDSGFYDGTIFHRVIDGFVIQGGGLDEHMKEKPNKAPIKNESGNGLTNLTYTLSMARTQALDSATSQFFINLVDNIAGSKNVDLDSPKYAVFGKVIEGQEVVKSIGKVKTTSKGPYDDVPVEPIKVIKASRK